MTHDSNCMSVSRISKQKKLTILTIMLRMGKVNICAYFADIKKNGCFIVWGS